METCFNYTDRERGFFLKEEWFFRSILSIRNNRRIRKTRKTRRNRWLGGRGRCSVAVLQFSSTLHTFQKVGHIIYIYIYIYNMNSFFNFALLVLEL